MDVECPEAGFCPAAAAVFDDGDSHAETRDETADDKVGGVGAARGGFKCGKKHGHGDFVGLRGRRNGLAKVFALPFGGVF